MAEKVHVLSTREVRANLAAVINEAAVSGIITYITSHGRRIAAVVPVSVANAAAGSPEPSDS